MTGEQEKNVDFDVVIESATPSSDDGGGGGGGVGDPPTDGVDDSGHHVPDHVTPSTRTPPRRSLRHHGMRGQRRASLVDIMGETRRASLQVHDLHQAAAKCVQQISSNENENDDNNEEETLGKSLTFQDYLDAQRKLRSVRHMDLGGGGVDIHHFYESFYESGNIDKLMSYEEEEENTGEQQQQGSEQKGQEDSPIAIMKAEEALHDQDSHGHHHHHSSSSSVPFYAPPLQRQRWGDDQVLPHVDWGDIFFDLFYVAAAYNLGGLVISFLNTDDWRRGMVYFVGIFGPLYNTWENEVFYSARYTLVDYSHRLGEIIRFFFVSAAVMHIAPMNLLQDEASSETFFLTLSIFMESVMVLIQDLEVFYVAQGDRLAIKNHTRRKIWNHFLFSLVYMTAVIISGYSYLRDDSDDDRKSKYNDNSYGDNKYGDTDSNYGGYEDKTGTSYNAEPYDSGYGDKNATTEVVYSYKNSTHRFLAAASDYEPTDTSWSIADVPLALCCAAYIANIIWAICSKCGVTGGIKGDIRDHFIPNNIDYMIHRYGEWIMLMIGESILSLSIVETTDVADYYLVASFGVLTVILLQILKFESEPAHADEHALWRNQQAGMSFSILIQIISMGLIAFGVSFKVFLTTIHSEASEDAYGYESDSYGEEYGDDSYGDKYGSDYNDGHRMLAAVPTIADKAMGALYCGSLTIVLLSMELMLGTHRSVQDIWSLLYHDRENGVFNIPIVAISILKFVLIAMVATLNKWVTDPTSLTLIGFGVVTALAITRVVGWGLIHKKHAIRNALSFVKDSTINAAHAMEMAAKAAVNRASSFGGDSKHSRGSRHRKSAKRTEDDDSSVVTADSFIGTSSQTKKKYNLDHAVLDSSFDAIIVTDHQGIIRHANATALAEFGYTSKEILDNNIAMLVGGNESHKHASYMDAFHKSGRTSTTIGKQRRLFSRRKDGSEFPCIIGIKEMPGQKDLLIGYIRNITDMVQIENDKLNSYIDESSFDAIVVADDHGIIKRVNTQTLTLFRYDSKDELEGQNLSILVGGGHAANHDGYVRRFHESGDINSTLGKQRKLVSKRKDGSEFTCVIGLKKIPETKYMIGYIRDMTGISDEQRASHADDVTNLTKRVGEDTTLNDVFGSIIDETSFDAIIVADGLGTIRRVNVTAVSIFGYNSKEELEGKNLSVLVGGGHAKHHDKYVQDFHDGVRDSTVLGKQRILKSKRKDGTEFPCVIGVKKIPDTDFMVGYVRDISGLSDVQREAEADDISNKGSIATRSVGPESVGVGSTDKVDLLDESFDAVVVTDLKGVIQKVNATALESFGYESKDELVGKNISTLVGGGEADRHDKYLDSFNKRGKQSTQIGRQRVLYSRRKDGTEFPCIIGIKRIPNSDMLVGYIRDMSGVKEGSPVQITGLEILRKNEAEGALASLVDETSFDSIVVIDINGIIRKVNTMMVSEFGYESKDELEGQNVQIIMGSKPMGRVHHNEFIKNFFKFGREERGLGEGRTLKAKRKDGSMFPCLIGIRKVPDQELLIGYIRNMAGFTKAEKAAQGEEIRSRVKEAVVNSGSVAAGNSSIRS